MRLKSFLLKWRLSSEYRQAYKNISSSLSPFVPTGVGSDPNYNPHGGYGGGDFDVSAVTGSVMSGLGSAFGALSTVAGSAVAAVQDESTRAQLNSPVKSNAGNFWG